MYACESDREIERAREKDKEVVIVKVVKLSIHDFKRKVLEKLNNYSNVERIMRAVFWAAKYENLNNETNLI